MLENSIIALSPSPGGGLCVEDCTTQKPEIVPKDNCFLHEPPPGLGLERFCNGIWKKAGDT